MKYKFYTTSEKAWDAMLENIKNAKKSIYLEMYIFINNTLNYDFFGILKKKAEEGIDVKIIIDSFGSKELNQKIILELKSAGIELLFFSYWLRRTHKKILVIDENTAFLGGVNIHKLFRKWNDLQIRFNGPIVKSVIRSFAKSYQMCGGKDKKILIYRNKKSIFRKTKIWFLEHQQVGNKSLIKKHYQDRIQNAKEKIIIITPYFVPRRWFIGALHQAILKGVNVEIILPQHTDHWIFDRINYFYISKLCHIGIKFYLQKEMNHAKAVLIDNREGLVGSQNIDPISFDHNIEAGIFFNDEKMVRDLEKIIDDWRKNSFIFNSAIYKKKWFDYIFALIGNILQIVFF
ncbi:MAG: phosphatidylserine/phosphatidylglycerophosphate/cardiolipin synthase family protein [Patescibacteria group bacterium]